MALLITIMVVSLLIAVTVQFNRTARNQYSGSVMLLEGQRLQAVALSGVTIGQALLEADGAAGSQDDLQESWAAPDQSELASLFPDATLQLQMIDLSGQLQVNSLIREGEEGNVVVTIQYRDILKRLLLLGNFGVVDEQQAQEIVDALTDWLDSDDRESDYGAEDSYYLSLNPPYSCRNGPVESIEELLLVKGISPALLYGEAGRPGLADFLTVYGEDGHININTAPVAVLQALHPLMTEDLALTIDEYRRDSAHIDRLADPGWYRDIAAWPGDIDLPPTILSTRSFYFRLQSSGKREEFVRTVTVVVKRDNENNLEILDKVVE
ncbi:MAG: type II secretion system minor pseudopilin GspK [Desulfopila sp.]